ncbi:hypothetical protein GA0070564_103432 [Micromonospora mirobrigensis]|uniref:Uncharacterized protein n=1 Tax=Micromonospora mirobrigensis TaxID=262898 RepID=A0A1C4XYT3_9ACTN|nr:hypothetical protein GA0070564_103432 [Micromonospora mirobrigensis]
MIKLFRRRHADAQAVRFCDSCGQVCTAACRADAHYQRNRATALVSHIR